MESARQFLKYLRPYRGKIILTLLAMGGAALMTGAFALLVKNIVDDVLLSKDSGALITIILILLIVSAVAGVCLYVQKYYSSYIGQRIVLDLRKDLYNHVVELSPAFFSKQPTPQVLSRIINDVGMVSNVLQNAANTLVKEGLTIFVLIGVVIYRDWSLALFSLLVFPVIAFLVHHFGHRLQKQSKRRFEQMGKVVEKLSESLRNQRVIQAFGQENHEKGRFDKENTDLFSKLMRIAKTNALSGPAVDLIKGLGFALVIVVGSLQIRSGSLTPGTFVSFFTALGLLYMPLKRMVNLFNLMNEGIGATGRIFEILNTSSDIQDQKGAGALEEFKKEIQFENLSFTYNGQWALSDVSFSVQQGEVVALVGPSGAGKSTLMNLLLRFYDPNQGKITLDGQDIKTHLLSSLRSQISWVSQEDLLFNDTVYANIAYGRMGASEEEVQRAAQDARAAQFIEKLPEGYQTVIGENGSFLSGGERQRLCIARAFLKDAPILLLDEATSAVDAPTESLIQDAIRAIVKNRTTLVIAHRPSTIALASKIVLLAEGKLLAVGDHRTLLEQNELYKKLYRSQFLHLAS